MGILLKEARRYYRGIKFTSGFHRVIIAKLKLKKDGTVTLRDGTSTKFGSLYWGLVNIKHLKGSYGVDDGKLYITLRVFRFPLRLFLTCFKDLYIVGEVLGDEVYRPLVNTDLEKRIVVDAGSFIGISPIYFALQGARVLAYSLPFFTSQFKDK